MPRSARLRAAALPYADCGEFIADLDVIADSLTANGGERIARGRLRHLRRAADVFGFHLCALDMRQHSGVHEQVIAELFARSDGGIDYAALPESEKIALLLREIATPRPLRSPYLVYSEGTAKELEIFDTAAAIHRRFGAQAMPNYIISKTDGVSDLLEAALLLKEAGLLVPGSEPRLAMNIIPLFETIDDLRALRRDHGRVCSIALLPQAAGEPRQRSGSDAGLFRQQQGRRIPHRQLGAVQGRG